MNVRSADGGSGVNIQPKASWGSALSIVAITVQATYGWRTTYGLLSQKKKKDAGTFSPILDKEQGGYEALLGRPWLQPGHDWANKKKSQAGMEGGKGLALFHRKRTPEIWFP